LEEPQQTKHSGQEKWPKDFQQARRQLRPGPQLQVPQVSLNPFPCPFTSKQHTGQKVVLNMPRTSLLPPSQKTQAPVILARPGTLLAKHFLLVESSRNAPLARKMQQPQDFLTAEDYKELSVQEEEELPVHPQTEVELEMAFPTHTHISAATATPTSKISLQEL
jgi:hypothetical protein